MANSKFQVSTPKFWRSRILMSFLAIAGLTIFANHAHAQPICVSPQPGEYLLLIVTQTPEQQDRAKRSLPQDVSITFCRYFNYLVTRVGGFANPQVANDAARYFQEKVGLQAYVVQPGVAPPLASSPNNTPAPAPRFIPQPLGPGYAVLVDYLNQPQLGGQVQQVLGRRLDLVSYGQRSYLLAIYTSDQSAAISTLKSLSDRGFLTMLVDSRRVTVIGQAN